MQSLHPDDNKAMESRHMDDSEMCLVPARLRMGKYEIQRLPSLLQPFRPH